MEFGDDIRTEKFKIPEKWGGGSFRRLYAQIDGEEVEIQRVADCPVHIHAVGKDATFCAAAGKKPVEITKDFTMQVGAMPACLHVCPFKKGIYRQRLGWPMPEDMRASMEEYVAKEDTIQFEAGWEPWGWGPWA